MRRQLAATLAAGLMVVGFSAALAAPTVAAPPPKEPKLSVTIADSKTPGYCVVKWRASNYPTDLLPNMLLRVYDQVYDEPYSITDQHVNQVVPIYFDAGKSSGSQEVSWSTTTEGTFSAATFAYISSSYSYGGYSIATDLAVPNRCKP